VRKYYRINKINKFKHHLILMNKKIELTRAAKTNLICTMMWYLKIKVKSHMIRKINKIYFSFIKLWTKICKINKTKSILLDLSRLIILVMDMLDKEYLLLILILKTCISKIAKAQIKAKKLLISIYHKH